MYVVIRCPQCMSLVLGDKKYKTRKCQKCGLRIILRSMKTLGETDSSREATLLIQELKKRDVAGDII